MSTVDPEFSRVNFFNREKDFSVVAKDDSHVRILKLFPMCRGKALSLHDYRRFHLRFYIPREIFDDKCSKVSKLFIFLNGLDELDYFTLYDQLGQGLAKYNYASVLLPLPDHLNRNKKYRVNDPKVIEKPSDLFINERDKIYSGYLQLLEELEILLKHLRHGCYKSGKNYSCGFYRHLFNKDLSISILGYSLGGLGALSSYLLYRKQFNTCILLNSGAKLDDIDVSEFIQINNWKNMVAGIQRDWDINFDTNDKARLFDKIFLGNKTSLLKSELKEISRNLCFILGGSDSVTKYKSIQDIEPDAHGLATLKIPGINHFLSIDLQWNKWFKLVVNTIAQFDESASKEVLSQNEIVDEFIQYQIKYKIFDGPGSCILERISDANDKLKFFRVLYAAEGIYKNKETAIIEMYIAIEKMVKRPNLYPAIDNFPHNQLFGKRASTAFKVSGKTIYDLLKKQRDFAVRNEKIPRIGELLVENNVISNEQRNALIENDS